MEDQIVIFELGPKASAAINRIVKLDQRLVILLDLKRVLIAKEHRSL